MLKALLLLLASISAVAAPKAKIEEAPLVKQVSRLKFEVSRKALEEELGDGTAQLGSFTALPAFDEGPFSGLRVSGFTKRCLLPRFGVQEGDVVAAVQGIRLRTPADVMEVAKRLENLRTGAHVRVEVRRDGDTVTQNYLVVD